MVSLVLGETRRRICAPITAKVTRWIASALASIRACMLVIRLWSAEAVEIRVTDPSSTISLMGNMSPMSGMVGHRLW